MKKTIVLVLCSALILVSGDTASDVKSKTLNDKVNPPLSATSTTVAPENTAASSTTSKTTTTSTTSTTTPSTTTTSTTTHAPTTTPASTTTHAPVPPTPVPNPETNKWNITGPDGNQIIAKMAVQLIMYNSTTQKANLVINVPANNETYVSGVFDKNSESMTLAWKSINSNVNNSLTLYFKQDSKTYLLDRVEVSVVLPTVATPAKFVHKQEHFNTTLGNSYRCIRLQTFNLKKENDDKVVVGEMKVSNLQFQAFKSDHKENFGLAEDCAFDTPDVVPIAVGCILAGAVVIVLVAYLISRRRSQAQGYHSM